MLRNIMGSGKKKDYKILRNIDDNIQTVVFLEKNDNPLSSQGLLMNEKLYKLLFFEKSTSNLSYEFEKNVCLKFYFRDGVIIIQLTNPHLKINWTKVWNNQHSRDWSSMSWNGISKELDFINVLAHENSLK